MQYHESTFTDEEVERQIQALKEEDIILRRRTLSNLPFLAKHIGPERTKRELLPLVMSVEELGAEEYYQIARSLGIILEEVGGEQFLDVLLSYLKDVSAKDISNITNYVIESTVYLGSNISDTTFSETFEPFIISLTESPVANHRIVASSCICLLPQKFGEKTIKILSTLIEDRDYMVRGSIARYLSNIFSIPSFLDAEIVNTFIKKLIEDKYAVVQSEVPGLLRVLSNKMEFQDLIVQTVPKLINSQFITTKENLISHIGSILANVDDTEFCRGIIMKMSQEKMYSLRASALETLPFFYTKGCFDESTLREYVTKALNDEEPEVRHVLATSILVCAKDYPAMTEEILTKLIADSDIKVQLSALDTIYDTKLAVTAASNYMTKLSDERSWRTGRSIVNLLPEISSIVTRERFDSEFLPLLIKMMNHPAREVRTTCASAIEKLETELGTEWIEANIIPVLDSMIENGNFHIRSTAIQIYAKLSNPGKEEKLMRLVHDPVPNVRITLAKSISDRNSPILKHLSSDSDQDVSHIAQRNILND